jgi:hypothetical protein
VNSNALVAAATAADHMKPVDPIARAPNARFLEILSPFKTRFIVCWLLPAPSTQALLVMEAQ